MNKRAPELTYHVLQPAMHEKISVRAAELIAMGWTRGTAARDATGQKVRSTAPQATAWWVVGGTVDRALYKLLNLDVYTLLGLDVDAYGYSPRANSYKLASQGVNRSVNTETSPSIFPVRTFRIPRTGSCSFTVISPGSCAIRLMDSAASPGFLSMARQ